MALGVEAAGREKKDGGSAGRVLVAMGVAWAGSGVGVVGVDKEIQSKQGVRSMWLSDDIHEETASSWERSVTLAGSWIMHSIIHNSRSIPQH